MLELAIEKRETCGTKALVKLRASGSMPAVLYGWQEETTPITVSQHDFKNVLKEAGESTVVVLSGIGNTKEALIHDVDVDPITGEPRHADFYIIEKGKAVVVRVPLEFEGSAPAIKELGGTLVKTLHEIEIEALPANLPHNIVVDISSLIDFDSQILAQDIKLPDGVTLVTALTEVVALASEAKEEEEETEETATPDLESIEVEKKGKEEAEGGETGSEQKE